MNELGQLPVNNFPKSMNEIFRYKAKLQIAVIFLACVLVLNCVRPYKNETLGHVKVRVQIT